MKMSNEYVAIFMADDKPLETKLFAGDLDQVKKSVEVTLASRLLANQVEVYEITRKRTGNSYNFKFAFADGPPWR